MGRPRNLNPCSVDGCGKRAWSKGMCQTHYNRVWRHGDPLAGEFRTRFEANIIKTDGCWLWGGSIAASGYGRTGKGAKRLRAHRAAYELYVGPIPDGMHVCHKCDVPRCVNPAHLFLGTHIDNMRDMEAKGRARWIQDNLRRNK